MKNKSYIYGRHPVMEALKQRPRDIQRLYIASGARNSRLSEVLRIAAHQDVPVVDMARRSLSDLVGEVPHQGIVAMVTAFAYVDIAEMLATAARRDEAPLIVVLDQIQDPHNLGAVVRSAFALGAHGAVIPKDRACEVTPTVVKTSAGATAHLNIAQVTNLRACLEELKGAGLWVIGTVADEAPPPDRVDFLQPTALVVGSEGKGLRPLVRKSCDVLTQIPMTAALGSLNASVAAGIALYEAARQRRLSG